jgi:DNA-binding transcriptional ArsR family regulator
VPGAGNQEPTPTKIGVLYFLTGIYLHSYIPAMDSTFAIVAEPNRRAILGMLVTSERSAGDIVRQLRISQPAASKHLRVLREAGFVESRIDAQRRLYRLRMEPLMELDAWLVPFRRLWATHLDALERHLDHADHASASTTPKGKRKP